MTSRPGEPPDTTPPSRDTTVEEVRGYTRTTTRDPTKWRKPRLPEATRKRMVKLSDEGLTYAEIAQTLTREQLPSGSGRTDWTANMARQALAYGHRNPEAEAPRGRTGRPRVTSDELLGRMAAMRDDEGLTYAEIAARLNADGATTATGRQWSRQSVAHHLRWFRGAGG